MEQPQTTQSLRSQHDVVTLQNPDDEDFIFEFDRSRGNYPYTIKAGAVARFPRFLADHALKHLIDKLLNKQHIKTNNEAARANLRDKIFVGEEVFQQGPQESEAERLKQEVEALNAPSDLDRVLSRAKTNAPGAELPPVEEKGEAAPVAPVVKAKPTRNELFAYAQQAGLVLDEPDKDGKTLRETFTKMSVDDMMKELDYPLE